MTPEGKVKKWIDRVLDNVFKLCSDSHWYFKPPANGYGRPGIPDYIGCRRGAFFAIEAKSASGKRTALQIREAERIQSAGGRYFLVVGEDSPVLVELAEWLLQE